MGFDRACVRFAQRSSCVFSNSRDRKHAFKYVCDTGWWSECCANKLDARAWTLRLVILFVTSSREDWIWENFVTYSSRIDSELVIMYTDDWVLFGDEENSIRSLFLILIFCNTSWLSLFFFFFFWFFFRIYHFFSKNSFVKYICKIASFVFLRNWMPIVRSNVEIKKLILKKKELIWFPGCLNINGYRKKSSGWLCSRFCASHVCHVITYLSCKLA